LFISHESTGQWHKDTVHYNPLKHGLAKNVSDWPWSSFHRLVKSGYYDSGWGVDINHMMNGIEGGE
jgi:putative transposase